MSDCLARIGIVWAALWLCWAFVVKDIWWFTEIMDWEAFWRGLFLFETMCLTFMAAIAPIKVFRPTPAQEVR